MPFLILAFLPLKSFAAQSFACPIVFSGTQELMARIEDLFPAWCFCSLSTGVYVAKFVHLGRTVAGLEQQEIACCFGSTALKWMKSVI